MRATRRTFLKVCATGVGSSSLTLLGFAPDTALAEVRNFKPGAKPRGEASRQHIEDNGVNEVVKNRLFPDRRGAICHQGVLHGMGAKCAEGHGEKAENCRNSQRHYLCHAQECRLEPVWHKSLF